MRLTDWLGTEYGVGDTIVYPVGSGRSVEMQQATVLDIWTVYNCPKDYKWKRLKEGEEVPSKLRWNADTHEREPNGEPVDTQLRVRLQPNGKGSRDFHTRTDDKLVYIDPDGNDITYDEMISRLEPEHGAQYTRTDDIWLNTSRNWDYRDFGYTTRRDAVTPKPVTLINYENITVVKSN